MDIDNASAATYPVMGSEIYSSGVVAVGDNHDHATHVNKRAAAAAGLESSPGSVDDPDDIREERRRQPVKRACNECRQQKVSFSCKIPAN